MTLLLSVLAINAKSIMKRLKKPDLCKWKVNTKSLGSSKVETTSMVVLTKTTLVWYLINEVFSEVFLVKYVW